MSDLSENSQRLTAEKNKLKKDSIEHRKEVKDLYNKAIAEAPAVSGGFVVFFLLFPCLYLILMWTDNREACF